LPALKFRETVVCKQQQRGAKIGRDHARRIQLERQCEGLALRTILLPDLALLDTVQKPPCARSMNNDEGDHGATAIKRDHQD